MRDILDDARKTLAGPGVATGWLIAEMIREIERLRLTDAEREAIHWAIGDVADISEPPEDTLKGLLERTRKAT